MDVVRWIFNQYAYESVEYKKISSNLKEKGVPSQKAAQWSAITIRAIYSMNPTSDARFGLSKIIKLIRKKWNNCLEWVITEMHTLQS
ncbi:recombinase family protein [Paenibacillus sp. TAF43_2]|uniref:recombinase family protein n=1 Tax=Paenibacillus sp. TAF43_2 TaxID=3233069 RepID=UPI003F944636